QKVMFTIGDDVSESTTTQSPEPVKINEEISFGDESDEKEVKERNKEEKKKDKKKRINDLNQRLSGLSTELKVERLKYLELDEKYQQATRADRTETTDLFFLDYEMTPFNVESTMEMNELKDQVSTLTTQLERERQKNLKLEDKLHNPTMLDAIRDHGKKKRSKEDNTKEMNEVKQRISTLEKQLEEERKKNRKLEDKIKRHVRSTSE
ncbi:hypothetical protein PMAYCL1PPCAC_11153, partial [Pristionchus mayeri]